MSCRYVVVMRDGINDSRSFLSVNHEDKRSLPKTSLSPSIDDNGRLGLGHDGLGIVGLC